MTIKSLLLGSAAALVAVSGARAADAVVIPEPELVEYVRVCDVAGTGYFYIPGSETCLKISGYVQYEMTIDNDGVDNFEKAYEARLQFDAYRDTDFGALKTVIRTTAGGSAVPSATMSLNVDRAYFDLAGLRVGVDASAWDYGFGGGADAYNNGGSNGGTVRYTANFGMGSFTLSLEEDSANDDYLPSVVGVLGLSAGDFAATLGAVYEEDVQEWGAKATASYDFGMAKVGAGVQYSSAGASTYNTAYQWVFGGDISVAATDALTLGFGGQYAYNSFAAGANAWTIAATADYAITETLSTSLRVRYDDTNYVGARIRFKSSF